LDAKQMFMLFPTPLFTGKLPDLTLCDRVEAKVRELWKSGQGRTSPGPALAYMTPDNLQDLPEMKELVDVILWETNQILDVYKVQRDSHYITTMWANITNPNRRHHFHMHPNCLFCGLVYIKTPPGCGSTVFASHRQLTKHIEPVFLEKNDFNGDVFVSPAEKGRMLFWPSHVPHAVEEGTADESEERIIVAFNVMIRGRIELEAGRWDLR
jgi:uncharacterized protein (TIGR02466 family)